MHIEPIVFAHNRFFYNLSTKIVLLESGTKNLKYKKTTRKEIGFGRRPTNKVFEVHNKTCCLF